MVKHFADSRKGWSAGTGVDFQNRYRYRYRNRYRYRLHAGPTARGEA
ncbi:hypothetical protein [Leisingera sp. M658]|nr:hypothetical protein [Leisingera sp. M658]UWQ75658.1 hypothetical protein K3724_04085 [Leisingera sp. M658]